MGSPDAYDLAGQSWLRLQYESQRKLLRYTVVERFFLNLKMERVWQREYANHAEAKTDITAYIVGFCNYERLHSVLGNLPPSVFERNMAKREPIVVSEIS